MSPSINKKKASTNIINTIFSLGFTKTSSVQPSFSAPDITNKTDFGIIGDHCLMLLVPLIANATVYYSTKLFDLPIPICENGIYKA